MNLKEAFRFQNRLQKYFDTAVGIFESEDVTKTESTLLLSKEDENATDEVMMSEPETLYAEHITDMVRFALNLLAEKARLSEAISATKRGLDIDLDSEISLNIARQELARKLAYLDSIRPSEQVLRHAGTGYRFNAEGNQVSYRCDLRNVTTINFDRNVVRSSLRSLQRVSDETSAKIDFCQVSAKVDYDPPFDINASFAEAFESFVGAGA